MTDFIPPGAFEPVGVVGICVFIVVALMRGWIVPGHWVRSRIEEKDKQIDALMETTKKLSAVGETVDAVLTAVKDLAQKRGEGK